MKIIQLKYVKSFWAYDISKDCNYVANALDKFIFNYYNFCLFVEDFLLC